jgi:hypothetical protein
MRRHTFLISVIGLLTIVLVCEGSASPAVADGPDKPDAKRLRPADLVDTFRQHLGSIPSDPNFSRGTVQGFSDGFEVSFDWLVESDPPGSPGWARTDYMAHTGIYSAWAGADSLNPANGYVDDMFTLMSTIVDLSALSEATLAYETYYDAEALWDYGLVVVTDMSATRFGCGPMHTGVSSGWQRIVIDLTAVADCQGIAPPFDFTGAPVVIAFAFESDGTISGFAGFYVDDVVVTSGPPVGDGDLVNISTRGFVGTGPDILIGGFITENGPTRVLLRARGPAAVPGFLQDPWVELKTISDVLILDCDNWRACGSEQEIIDIGYDVGMRDQDAAVIVTLDDGAYTPIVRGVGGTTGVGIVEVIYLP